MLRANIKVGQSLIHDVKGRGFYTKECHECQQGSTSKVLIYVDFGAGAGPENVSKSCLHIDAVNPPKELTDALEAEDTVKDMMDSGIIPPSANTRRSGWKKVIVNACPNCGAQDELTVEPSYPDQTPDTELCNECSKKLDQF